MLSVDEHDVIVMRREVSLNSMWSIALLPVQEGKGFMGRERHSLILHMHGT